MNNDLNIECIVTFKLNILMYDRRLNKQENKCFDSLRKDVNRYFLSSSSVLSDNKCQITSRDELYTLEYIYIYIPQGILTFILDNKDKHTLSSF